MQNELVGKAVELYAMHYFMTQILVFTDDSAESAVKSLRRPTKLPYTGTLTSKLISLQIKRVMYALVFEKTGDTLTKLESTLLAAKGNEGTAWATSFCVIAILCMCVEMVQVAADLKIVHMMREEEGHGKLSRDDSKNHLRERPLAECQARFHHVFKSYKSNGKQKNERCFNPIRYGHSGYKEKGIDKATGGLIDEVSRVCTDYSRCPSLFSLKQAQIPQRMRSSSEGASRLWIMTRMILVISSLDI
jgi:hypothetical protein